MSFDAIFVLGGGVRDGGFLPPWAARRFDAALERRTTEPIVCLSAGTTHRPPPLDEAGFPVWESAAGAQYLLERGVAPSDILVETTSWDTVGNAYFSRILFADPRGWKKLLIVTSEFHMPRSQALFEWVYGMAPSQYDLTFKSASDAGFDEEIIQGRTAREQKSLASFRKGLQHQIRTLEELHRWLYSEHRAYSAEGRTRLEREHRPEVLASY